MNTTVSDKGFGGGGGDTGWGSSAGITKWMQIPLTVITACLKNLEAMSWFIIRPAAESTNLTMTNKIHIPQQARFKSCSEFITFWPRCGGIYECHFRFVCCPPTTSLVKPCSCSQVHFNFLVERCRCDMLGGIVTIKHQKRWFTKLKETERSRIPHQIKTEHVDSVLRITSAGLSAQRM